MSTATCGLQPQPQGHAMSVTLAQASTIVDVALKTAREMNLAPITVAILDAGGHLVAFKREDKSGMCYRHQIDNPEMV